MGQLSQQRGVVGRVEPDGRVDHPVQHEEIGDVRAGHRGRRRRTRCCGPQRRRPWRGRRARRRAGPRRRNRRAPTARSSGTVPGEGHRTRQHQDSGEPAPSSEVVQGRPRRPEPAHAVDAAARRGGGGAQVDALQRGAVRVPAHRRPEDHLAERGGARVDVPAHVARVVLLLVHRGAGRAAEDQVAKARGGALDLRLDPLGHVHVGPVGDVAVGPQCVAAGGSPVASTMHGWVTRQ